MRGIDFSYWRPPSAAWVKQQGFSFVCRYLSYDPRKTITKAEYDGYISAGLGVVLVWENGAQDMCYPQLARQHALDSAAQARTLGAPWPCPIYYACDFDATSIQQNAINQYLDIIAQAHGQRQGIYGGFYVVQRAMDGGHATYGWQTYAWSGGQWYGKA